MENRKQTDHTRSREQAGRGEAINSQSPTLSGEIRNSPSEVRLLKVPYLPQTAPPTGDHVFKYRSLWGTSPFVLLLSSSLPCLLSINTVSGFCRRRRGLGGGKYPQQRPCLLFQSRELGHQGRGLGHSPQKCQLSALPKLCGLVLSELPSARCQQCFCLLGGRGCGGSGPGEPGVGGNAFHLAFFPNRYCVCVDLNKTSIFPPPPLHKSISIASDHQSISSFFFWSPNIFMIFHRYREGG